MPLPFSHLNLRRNPFGELDLEEWPSVVVSDLDLASLSEALRTGGLAVQFLGECGRGKTSHLMALRGMFPDAPYQYFADGEAMPRRFPDGDVVFLDETQRIPARTRSRLWKRTQKRNGSLVIGTHLDHQAELKRVGLRVITHEVRGLSEDKLLAICERRVALVVRDPNAPVPRIDSAFARQLLQQHGDNLRAICHDLYDHFQTRPGVGNTGEINVQMRSMV